MRIKEFNQALMLKSESKLVVKKQAKMSRHKNREPKQTILRGKPEFRVGETRIQVIHKE